MHFVRSLVIARPPAEVWSAFVEPAFLRRWQPTLDAVEVLSGTPSQVGAVIRLTYREAGRLVVLTETVTESAEPRLIATRYDSGPVAGTIQNTFTPSGDGGTHWESTYDVRFQGALRFFGAMLGAATVHRLEGDMARFKELLESGRT